MNIYGLSEKDVLSNEVLLTDTPTVFSTLVYYTPPTILFEV